MNYFEERIKNIEIKTAEIQKEITSLEKELEEKIDENAVKVILEDRISKDDILTKAEIQSLIEKKLRNEEILSDAEIHTHILKILSEMGYITKTDAKNLVKKSHITLLKWVIGIVLTGGTMTLTLIRLFLM